MMEGGIDIIGQSPTLTKALIAMLFVAVSGFIGREYKQQRKSRSLEDNINDGTVETLSSARRRNAELEAQVRALLSELSEARMAQVHSEGAAARAAVQAELAAEAAVRTTEAAQRCRVEAQEALRLLRISEAHRGAMEGAMRAAGMAIPPVPTTA